MTEKRFYLMNVEDPLHEYGRWCKPVLEDGETGKQYEGALEVMNLLNFFNEENEQLNKKLRIYKSDRLETLNDLQRCYNNSKKAMKTIDALHEENEQLKSENHNLKKCINEIYLISSRESVE